ncbi:MAG: hypothetical protein M5U28_14780 [Sandaracinaceae bacterium]|nr:hypothetical protein [Sandaracinaceae bacterium]
MRAHEVARHREAEPRAAPIRRLVQAIEGVAPLGGVEAAAVVLDAQLEHVVVLRQRDAHRGGRLAPGLRDELPQGLAHALGVERHARALRHVHLEGEPAPRILALDVVHDLAHEAREVVVLALHAEGAALELGDRAQRPRQAIEAREAALGEREHPLVALVELAGEILADLLERAGEQAERRADVVREPREEVRRQRDAVARPLPGGHLARGGLAALERARLVLEHGGGALAGHQLSSFA